MVRRIGFSLLLLFLSVSLSFAQRSGNNRPPNNQNPTPSPPPMTGPSNAAGPGGVTRGGGRAIGFAVHVLLPNDHPAGRNIDVQLDSPGGGMVNEGFTNSEGQVHFDAVSPGSYVVRLRGPNIKDTTTDVIVVDPFDTEHTEYVHAQPIDVANPLGSTQGSISTAELEVPGNARKELEKGNQALAKGDSSKAIENYKKAIALYPKYALAYNNLGVGYMRTNDPASAQQAWQRALQADPNMASACANLARFDIQEKRYPHAIVLLQKALSTQPSSPDYLLLMSEAQFLSTHFDQALVYARKVYSVKHEKYELAHIIAGRALEAEHHPDQARLEYEVLIKESPSAPEAEEARKSLARLDSVASK
jgi:Tetratricopeptide repeat